MFTKQRAQVYTFLSYITVLGALGWMGYGCNSASAGHQESKPPAVSFITLDTGTATLFNPYSASLEGKVNVEVRAQVEGYLDQIFIDEGQFVKQGQPLFRINDLPYQEQLNTALANLQGAEAELYTAELELEKVKTLLKSNVVSEVQLKTAEAAYKMAAAKVELAKAGVALARINLGYTLIKAPVNGYIGRIPKKMGSLVGRADVQALTILSDISEVYAYFSMSEADFMVFQREHAGTTMEEKIKGLPPVSLLLADGSTYTHEGRVQLVDGQFNRSTGSISLRAVFPNPDGILRSGNTGQVVLGRLIRGVILVPQEATVEMQEKTFVYILDQEDKVTKQPVTIIGKSGDAFVIDANGFSGARIVSSGLNHLQEGMIVTPQQDTLVHQDQ